MTENENEEEYVKPAQVPVQGPFFCEKHGRDVDFVFVYSTRTYHHVHKNGALCSYPVEIKRW